MRHGTSAVTVESLLDQAKHLSDNNREELARRLFDSLPPLPESPTVWDSDEEADAAWDDELQRRLDEVDSGTTELASWNEALGEMRETLRRKGHIHPAKPNDQDDSH